MSRIDWNIFKPLREQVKAERIQREQDAENFRRRLAAFRRQNPQIDGLPVPREQEVLE
jgi:hypothetical protein